MSQLQFYFLPLSFQYGNHEFLFYSFLFFFIAAADEIKIHNLSQALAEERKNVEKLRETIENTRRNASEDVEREKVTCRQLREALNNLQVSGNFQLNASVSPVKYFAIK